MGLGVAALGFAGSLAVVWALRAFPNSADEYAFHFEAATFLAGRLWNPLPPLHECFSFLHIIELPGRWVALYPPGWPLLLAGMSLARLPTWLACPLAGIVLLYAVYQLGRRQDGPLGGILAAALVALSPFFLFNAGSYFTHVPTAAAGALFCWMAADFLDRPRLRTGILAGAALGMVGLIRPFNTLPFAVPFLVAFLWRARIRDYVAASSIALGGLPFLAALMLFYDATIGSPLPDWAKFGGSLVKFGLYPRDEFGVSYTPLDQLIRAGVRMIDLAQWTSPLLLLGYVAALVWKAARGRLSFLDFIFPATLAGFLLVPFDGGNQYGPRYYFEGYPFLVLTVVSALVPLLQNRGRPRSVAFGASLVFAHLLHAVAVAAFLGWFLRERVDERMDVYDQVRAQGLHHAVIVLRSGTGRSPALTPKDLTRNGLALDGDVIYALDIPDRLGELRALFPDRRFFLYRRDPDSTRGSLNPF